MVRMPPIRAWCPRYRPTHSFGCISLATVLATAGRWQTDSPNYATSFFQARPDRLISAVKSSFPILKKLIALSTSRWKGVQRPFPHTLQEQLLEFASAASPHPQQTQQHHSWRALQSDFDCRTYSTNGDDKKVAVLRAAIDGSPSLCNIPLRYSFRRNKDTHHDVTSNQ